MQQATCKLKMAKRNWNVIKLNNNHNVCGEKGQIFFFDVIEQTTTKIPIYGGVHKTT